MDVGEPDFSQFAVHLGWWEEHEAQDAALAHGLFPQGLRQGSELLGVVMPQFLGHRLQSGQFDAEVGAVVLRHAGVAHRC